MKMLPLAAVTLSLLGCATTPASNPQDRFFERLSSLCGMAYAGIVSSPPVATDAAFTGKQLIMHVRDCSADEIRMPFHVGDDRSRTWVVTRTANGLRLKHDHRHEDGTEDALTQYGGDTLSYGTERRQEFPADAYSKELFTEQNSAQSVTNIWAMEVEPGQVFAYELRRPGRFFRVDFDLTRPVPPPPPPWGSR
jgi:hypothetical protein